MKRTISILLVFGMLCGSQAAYSAVAADEWSLGNSDLNILNGGVFLIDGQTLYYSEPGNEPGNEPGDSGGVFLTHGDETRRLTPDSARNLNLSGAYIYYSSGADLRRIPVSGGSEETLYTHDSVLGQMYVVSDRAVKFTADGAAWELALKANGTASGTPKRLWSGVEIIGLIPTSAGDLFLAGECFDYDIYIGSRLVLEHVSSAYTDSGHLVLNIGGTDYQLALESLFGAGFDAVSALEPFNLHGAETLAVLFALDDNMPHVCEVCEANAEAYAEVYASLHTDEDSGGYVGKTRGSESGADDADESQDAPSPELPVTEQPPVQVPETPAVQLPTVSDGQKNIVKRARQQHEIRWTPLESRSQWGSRGTFEAGTTYVGVPYGQPVYAGYVPWYIGFTGFLNAVNNNSSKFYTEYSTYNKIAPTYSSDCSSFVSWAWGMSGRLTTYSIPQNAVRVGDQSIYSLQVGDCLNERNHVVLVSDLRYDAEGNMAAVEIMEQTPVITKRTLYGEGGSYPLSRLVSYYLSSGYTIYRNPSRDSVSYTHDCAVPLDGDYCAQCKTPSPVAKTEGIIGGKSVTLTPTYDGTVIYYTLDGSVPSTASSVYTETLQIKSHVKLRAIAVSPDFPMSWILEYDVPLTRTSAPTAELSGGLVSGSVVEKGTKLTLKSPSPGAVIYYTTDGSVPTTESLLYSGAIEIDADLNLRCIVSAKGYMDSEPVSFEYKLGQISEIEASADSGGSISPSGTVRVLEGGSRSFTIAAHDGWDIADVLVDGVSVGAVSGYEFREISGGHTINVRYREEMVHPFKDVAPGSWYASAVNAAYRRGLFSGTDPETFSPQSKMTRGMFATVIGRVAGIDSALRSGVAIITGSGVNLRDEPNTDCEILTVLPRYTAVQLLDNSGGWCRVQVGAREGYIRSDYLTPYNGTFSDIVSTKYYAPYIEWAYLTGIVSGDSAAEFAPERDITREELCVQLYNYVQKYGLKLTESANTEQFKDDAKIVNKVAVYAMKRAGIVSGKETGEFDPLGSATRAEVAQIFLNLGA